MKGLYRRLNKSKGYIPDASMMTDSCRHFLQCLKKAFLSHFFRTRSAFCVHVKAGLTIEAALAFPLLLFFLAVIASPLRLMEEQRKLQNRLEAIGKDISISAYLEGLSGELLNIDEGYNEALWDILDTGIGAAGLLGILAGTDESVIRDMEITELTGIADTEEKGSEDPGTGKEAEASDDGEGADEAADGSAGQEPSDDEMFVCVLEYEAALPLGPLRLDARRMSSVVSRRKWTGSEGGRGRSRYGDGETEDGFETDDEGNRIVYVGKGSTRYHKDRHCHYIDNVMTAVAGDTVEELRNTSGGRYHPCPSCDAAAEGTVYIFEDGMAYHSSKECKAINAYVSACRLSEVEHLGPCSYCSRE